MKKLFTLFFTIIVVVSGILCGLSACQAKESVQMNTYTAESRINSYKFELKAIHLEIKYDDVDNVVLDYPTSSIRSASVTEAEGTLYYITKISKLTINAGTQNATLVIPRGSVPVINVNADASEIIITNVSFSTMKMDLDASSLAAKYTKSDTVQIEANAATLNVESFECQSFALDANASSAKVDKLVCPEITLEANAATIKANLLCPKSDYTIIVKTSASTCNVQSQKGETDKNINIDANASTVTLNFS